MVDALRLHGVEGVFVILGVLGIQHCTTKSAKTSSWEALLFKVSAKKSAVGEWRSKARRKLGSFKCASMSC